MKKNSILTVVLLTVLLAVGCTTEPGGESSESSAYGSLSEESSLSEQSVSISGGEISLPDDSSTEESSESEDVSDPGADVSGGIFRADGEPKLEDILLDPILEKGFRFTQSKLTLVLGKQGKIPYEFTPIGTTDRTLVWTSSNEKAVTVAEDGTLTAVGPGVSYIRATTGVGNYAECRVEVVESLPLSKVGSIVYNLTGGNPVGRSFAMYDVDQDGTDELLARGYGEDGLPNVLVLDTSSGETLLSLSTGTDEEWAVWRRTDGSRYILVSYTQPMEGSDVRYVMEELLTDADGNLLCSRVLAREAYADGSSRYFARIDGEIVSCDDATYQSVRQSYFAENGQIGGAGVTWVTGTDAAAIAALLEK